MSFFEVSQIFPMLGLTSTWVKSHLMQNYLFNLVCKKFLNFPLETNFKPIYSNSYRGTNTGIWRNKHEHFR